MFTEDPFSNPQENSVESIPTKEEILLEIKKFCENPEVRRELSDEKGIYFLEAQGPSETEYIYHRKGIFPGKNEALVTRIEAIYSKDGIPVGGENLSEYNPETKKWE